MLRKKVRTMAGGNLRKFIQKHTEYTLLVFGGLDVYELPRSKRRGINSLFIVITKKQSTTEPQRTQRGSKTQVFGFTLVQKKIRFASVSLWCQALKFGSIQILTIFSRDQNL